jgi:hypothetical protein
VGRFYWALRGTNLGPAAILAVEIQSYQTYADFDVGLYGDLADSPTIASESGGFAATASPVALHFLCAPQPGVTACSTYWFGAAGYSQYNGWQQTPASGFSAEGSIAVSWQGNRVERGKRTGVSFVIRRGDGSIAPVLTITTAAFEHSDSQGGILTIAGSVTDADSDSISVYAAFDCNYGGLIPIATQAHSGDTFQRTIVLSTMYVTLRDHRLDIFAVDQTGTFSEPYNATVYVSGTYGSTTLSGSTLHTDSSNYNPEPRLPPEPTTPVPPFEMELWHWALIGVAAFVVVAGVFGRWLFACCNFVGEKSSSDGSSDTRSENRGAPRATL